MKPLKWNSLKRNQWKCHCFKVITIINTNIYFRNAILKKTEASPICFLWFFFLNSFSVNVIIKQILMYFTNIECLKWILNIWVDNSLKVATKVNQNRWICQLVFDVDSTLIRWIISRNNLWILISFYEIPIKIIHYANKNKKLINGFIFPDISKHKISNLRKLKRLNFFKTLTAYYKNKS